jgi:hypothetical protein
MGAGGAVRRFRLVREEDVSGVSGTGVVAEGVVFSVGKVALSWCSPYRSVTIYESLDDLEAVHGHEGRTRIEWVDPPRQRAVSRRPRLAASQRRPTQGRSANRPVGNPPV